MVQGALCCGDSTSAGGAGQGDTIVCECCGLNGAPGTAAPIVGGRNSAGGVKQRAGRAPRSRVTAGVRPQGLPSLPQPHVT